MCVSGNAVTADCKSSEDSKIPAVDSASAISACGEEIAMRLFLTLCLGCRMWPVLLSGSIRSLSVRVRQAVG